MTTQAAPTTKKTRGDGAAIFTYVDAAGKNDHSRVPADVKGILVKSRAKGTSVVLDPNKLPEATKANLVAYAVANMIKMQVNNHAADDGSDVIEISNAKFADLMAGKVYTRNADGTSKVGKVFDAGLYVEAMKLALKEMSDRKMTNQSTGKPYRPMTTKDEENFKASLMGMTGQDRTKKINAAKKNKFFATALFNLKNKAISPDDSADLSF